MKVRFYGRLADAIGRRSSSTRRRAVPSRELRRLALPMTIPLRPISSADRERLHRRALSPTSAAFGDDDEVEFLPPVSGG